jgi:acyl-CoA thioesterase FadM
METFIHSLVVLIKHTQLFGDVYWNEFNSWVGEARELFFFRLLGEMEPDQNPKKVFEGMGVVLNTESHSIAYSSPAFFGDRMEVRINTSTFRSIAVTLQFEIFNLTTGKISARGKQQIVFTSAKTGRPCRIPDGLRRVAEGYQAEMTPAVAQVMSKPLADRMKEDLELVGAGSRGNGGKDANTKE